MEKLSCLDAKIADVLSFPAHKKTKKVLDAVSDVFKATCVKWSYDESIYLNFSDL